MGSDAMITAVAIAPQPFERSVLGLKCVTHIAGMLTDAAKVQAAWFASIALVRTPWFFWFDTDDALPDDHESVLVDCVSGGAAIAFTDERVIGADGGDAVRQPGPYIRANHQRRPMLLHHLVLCNTDAARAVLPSLPRGHYWPEMLLYWALARDGAHYVPRVGYHWHRGNGLSARPWTTIAQMRSALWCKGAP